MTVKVTFEKYLIAACGINCGTCIAYLRNKNKCAGCESPTGPKVNHCSTCSIKNCDSLQKTKSKLCYECEKFPCQRIRQIDKRYRTKYHTGLIQNLETIKNIGIGAYLLAEEKRWTCLKCGSTLSVHRENCIFCSKESIK